MVEIKIRPNLLPNKFCNCEIKFKGLYSNVLINSILSYKYNA